MLRIWVGDDSRFPEPAQVLAHSIRRHASIPVDIRFLRLDELAAEHGYHPQERPASNYFTYSRFLVPYLCGYEGKALFCDNDLVCFADVRELDLLPLDGLALRCTQHDYRPPDGEKFGSSRVPQTSYPRKLWASFMLLDCARLRCWTKELVETASGARLHRFQDVPDEQIGTIDLDWNEVYDWTPRTKMYHWTEGVPCLAGCENAPHAELWRQARAEWLSSCGRDPLTPVVPIFLE